VKPGKADFDFALQGEFCEVRPFMARFSNFSERGGTPIPCLRGKGRAAKEQGNKAEALADGGFF
jgi:hypothetical protein